MKLLFQRSREHLQDQNETYLEHMLAAWKIVWTLKVLEVKCLMHSFCPGLFTTAVSEKIECLEKMVKRGSQ